MDYPAEMMVEGYIMNREPYSCYLFEVKDIIRVRHTIKTLKAWGFTPIVQGAWTLVNDEKPKFDGYVVELLPEGE
jgi:hypothetical protein